MHLRHHHHKRNPCNFLQPQRSCMTICVFMLSFLTSFFSSVQCDDYLKEQPSFLKSCTLNDPKNGVCLAKAVENIFTNWRDGIPGLKSVGSIDPLNVKKVHVEQSSESIDLNMDFKDIVIAGLSQTKVVKASVKEEYNFKFLVKIPLVHIKANYRMKGTILLLNLDSTGPMEAEISDVDALISLKAKLVTTKGHKFFELTNLKSSIKNIGKLSTSYGNLFKDSPELSASANTLFNQNWRQILEIMRPTIEETLDAIAINRYKKIFNYVPANYFFVDLP